MVEALESGSAIFECKEGPFVERGTHEELYAKGGVYTQLVTDE